MSEEEREAFYDSEIAPALLALGKKCRENGLSLVASVEWAPQASGRTAFICEGADIGIQMTNMAAQCNGNADNLIMGLMRHARKYGHNSAYLGMLLKD